MTGSTTLTVALSAEVRDQLSRLAAHRHVDQTLLGAQAIGSYVADELAIVDAVVRGQADLAAGRTLPHEDAMERVRAAIQAVSRHR